MQHHHNETIQPHATRASIAILIAGFLLAGCVACGGHDGTGTAAAPVITGQADAGTGSGGDATPPPPVVQMTDTPTWHRDIAPIVSQRCAGCHRTGGIAPFSLVTYENAKPMADAMADAVHSGLMPPWGARETESCKPRMGFRDDARLSATESALLSRWAETGAPEGDAASASALRAAPATALEGANKRITMANPFVVEGRKDIFRCFALPYEFAEDVWLSGMQVVPGNSKVVHHVLVWLDKDKKSAALQSADGSYDCFGAPGFDSQLMGAWAPGGPPTTFPANVGLRIPKGSKIVINVHYHPGRSAESDASSLDLKWSTKRPQYEALLSLVGNASAQQPNGDGLQPGPNDPASGPRFVIPAQARGHEEKMRFTLPAQIAVPLRLFSVGTHMHYVGTGMRIEIDRTRRSGGAPNDEPTNECLVETPEWDFHWQRAYDYAGALDAMPTVRAGDVINLRCTYDNSMNNPFVAQALSEQGLKQPRDVALGEETLDEMCLGVFGVAVPALFSN